MRARSVSPRWLTSRVGWRQQGFWLLLGTSLFFHLTSAHAVTLTNTSFSDFLAAVQSGGNVTFATNGTVTFTQTVIVSNTTTLDATGFSVILSGNNAVRLFQVQPNVSLTLVNLSVVNGNLIGAAGEPGEDGQDDANFGRDGMNGSAGNSVIAGAVYNEGSLNLVGCRLTGNSVTGGDGGDGGNGGSGEFQGGNGGDGGNGGSAQGGAIYNAGFLLITNCTFSSNTATGGGGGAGGVEGSGAFSGYAGGGGTGAEGSGAAIYSVGTIWAFNSTFNGNDSKGGDSKKAAATSGIGEDGANGGSGLGGAICNRGVLSLVNCTVAENQVTGGNAGDGGDGRFQGGDGGDGGLASGGGVYSSVTATVTNCTFADGIADGGTNGLSGGNGFPGRDGSPGASQGGNLAASSGIFILANSILSNATNGNNGFGFVIDAGYNVSSDKSLNFTGPGSLKNTNLNLSELGDYGGLTETILPMAGSPAIDRGSSAACLLIDQRGVSRPAGNACDAGAVETSGLTIQTQPQSQTATVGATVNFNVIPGGDPPFTYQWRFNTNNIATETNMTLTLPNVQLTNAGSYSVVVSNPSGTQTSSAATLTVISPLTIGSPTLLDETNLFFAYLSATGQTYILEYKAALTDSIWIRLKTNAGTGGLLTNIVPVTGIASRYFRVAIE